MYSWSRQVICMSGVEQGRWERGKYCNYDNRYIRYSTLLRLPPLRFLYVGGCWDPTQDCCDFDIVSQTLKKVHLGKVMPKIPNTKICLCPKTVVLGLLGKFLIVRLVFWLKLFLGALVAWRWLRINKDLDRPHPLPYHLLCGCESRATGLFASSWSGKVQLSEWRNRAEWPFIPGCAGHLL